MKVLVAGAGAVGQWLGAILQKDGHQVTLLTRARHADALAKHGLTIRGRTELSGHIPAVTTAADAKGPFDVAFVTAKAHATAGLAADVAALLAPHGIAVSLQNGLGNEQKLLAHIPRERLAIASTSHGIDVQRPGHLHHAGTGATVVGPATSAPDGAARTVWDMLSRAGLEPQWQDNMRPVIWRKACVNHALNTVCALHRLRNGALLDNPELLGLAKGLLAEACQLAERARVGLDADAVKSALVGTLERTRENRNSMLQDVANQRPTEVEQISGRMVRLGEKLLVSMPRSDSMYGRIKDLEATYLGPEAATRMAWDEMQWEREPF